MTSKAEQRARKGKTRGLVEGKAKETWWETSLGVFQKATSESFKLDCCVALLLPYCFSESSSAGVCRYYNLSVSGEMCQTWCFCDQFLHFVEIFFLVFGHFSHLDYRPFRISIDSNRIEWLTGNVLVLQFAGTVDWLLFSERCQYR